MGKSYRIFDGELKVDKIGGRLASDYYHLRTVLLNVSGDYFPLIKACGLNRDKYLKEVLLCLGRKGDLSSLYVEKITEGINEGRLEKAKYFNKKWIVTDTPKEGEPITPEMEKRLNKERTELQRALKYRYKEIKKEFNEIYKPSTFYLSRHYMDGLALCSPALYFTTSGIAIDVPKFIEFYKDFIKADESKHKEAQQKAADAINAFFSGAVVITEEELKRYFILENGIVKINPSSVNLDSYSRLGKRTYKVVKD